MTVKRKVYAAVKQRLSLRLKSWGELFGVILLVRLLLSQSFSLFDSYEERFGKKKKYHRISILSLRRLTIKERYLAKV